MAEISAGHTTHTASVAWWRDERKRAIIWQLVVVALLLLAIWFIINNMIVEPAHAGRAAGVRLPGFDGRLRRSASR